MPGGGPAETRRLSFRALGVEQIGHVYEGLLDHTAKRAKGPVVSLRGSKNLEPEIELEELERRRAQGQPEQLVSYLAEETGRSASAIKKGFEYRLDDQAARHFLTACDNDGALYGRVAGWAGLIREDSHGNPVIFPVGSVYVTEGTARRSTGTHYTPPSLTEPVVQYTLEPLVYEGPSEGWPREKWQLRTAKKLLALRVCDFAMGSGAFLVQACRYLSERIVEAWDGAEQEAGRRLIITPDGELSNADPSERALAADTEERLAMARRYVADRCLYGVDINPMAVEMAKLSLWLVTLQKDRPFTFVDHALKYGDSLLGVTSIEQVEKFTLRDGPAQGLFANVGLSEIVEKVAQKRRALEALPSEHYDQVEHKRKLHTEAEAATQTVRAVADLLVALELRADARTYEAARGSEGERIRKFLSENDKQTLCTLAKQELDGRRPFHWAIEFPEVFSTGKFNGLISNPPYRHGSLISTDYGSNYLSFLLATNPGVKGTVDLAVHFLRRATKLISSDGSFGLILTKSIAEGENRQYGLADLLRKHGLQIRNAVRSQRWNGMADVLVSIVIAGIEPWIGVRILDGKIIDAISDSLTEGSVTNESFELKANQDICYKGSELLGDGFLVSKDVAHWLWDSDSKYRNVVRPILNGQEFASDPDLLPTRFVIDFGERDEIEARLYPLAFEIVEREVKPIRSTDNRAARRERFWKFGEIAKGLYEKLKQCEYGLARQFTGEYWFWERIPGGIVYTNALVIVARFDPAEFAFLQSSIHESWAHIQGSSLHTRFRYTPSRCFGTFPQPVGAKEQLRKIGEEYRDFRHRLMVARGMGLTATYARFHDPSLRSQDLEAFRAHHVRLDHAVAAAYRWTGLDFGHGFHETKQGTRFTISESARRIILDQLLALNHERYQEEVRAGLRDKGNPRVKEARSTPTPSAKMQSPSAQLGFAALTSPTLVVQPPVAVTSVPGSLDDHATALLGILNTAYAPLGKSALIEMAKIPESAWSAAIQTLKSQGLVEQHGEKRSTTYARKRS